MSVYSNKPMHICAEAFETIDKFEGFGGNVIADIEKAINHFQDQFKGIYFPVITENTVILRPDLRSNMIKPKVVSLFTYIGGKPISEGVIELLRVTLLSGVVLENGNIQWMLPITDGPNNNDPRIEEAENALYEKVLELEQNPFTRMSDEFLYLRGFEPHFRFSGVVRKVLNKLNQPLLVCDIDKSGNYTIKQSQ